VGWNTSGDASITVEESTDATYTVIGTTTQSYYVSPMPSTKTLVSGAVCSGTTGSITVQSSEVNVSYQLRLNSGNLNVGSPASGTGVDVSLSTGNITTTTNYNVLAYNAGCSLQIPTSPSYITVTVNPLPTVTISGLATSATSCDGNAVQVNIVFTGAPPFAFTMQDAQGHSWSVSGINVTSGSTYTYSIPAAYTTWLGPSISTTYTYSITSASDNNACNATSISGSATVNVYKIPETGDQYHISNTKSY